jgi:acetylornithine/succinyldiaminopimelate/putrescine aminotransferase
MNDSAMLPVYPRLPLEVVGAKGSELFTSDGRTLLDLYGGHAVCPLGHGHPELTETLTQTHATLDFYSNSLYLPVQQTAAEAVLGDSAHLRHVHFVNSGTEANEAALHLARRQTGRETVVSLDNAFHGRTLASLTATQLGKYRTRLSVAVPEHWSRMLPFGDVSAIDAVVRDDVAAVILESVPSLGGVVFPDADWLAAVFTRAREVGAMVIFDEVQGGVGRLGRWFAHERMGVKPDMVTLAKSLGGGFPVGALVTTAEVGERIAYSELGTTFGGAPMAAAMVTKVAEIIRRDGLMARTLAIFERVSAGLADLDEVTVRGGGCLIGLHTPLTAKELRSRLLEHDILVGVSGEANTARLLPSYTVTDDELDRFVVAIREVFRG